jgi:RHS repeat-associated protein
MVLLSAASPMARAAKQVTYYYTDPQGTILAETDAAGNLTATMDYRSFGLQALGAQASGPGYTDHVADEDVALIYMQQRYYDPSVGRFLSADPLMPTGGDRNRFSRFAYANDSPYLNVDPDGRETLAVGISGSVAAIAGITGTKQLTISMDGLHISTFNMGYYYAAGGTASTAIGPSANVVLSLSAANSAPEYAATGGYVTTGGAINAFGGAVGYEQSVCDHCNHIRSVTFGLKIPQLPVEFHTSVTQSQGTTVLDVSSFFSSSHPTVTVGDDQPAAPPPLVPTTWTFPNL